MIPVDQLALISCHLCRKLFEDGDSVSTIASKRFKTYNMTFEEMMVRADEIDVPKEINFHEECFMEVAGKNYTP